MFEAVSEDLSVKRQTYENILRCCGEDVIIASCTSSLGADELGKLTGRPENFLVAHPFQPVHLQPLVELVPGRRRTRRCWPGPAPCWTPWAGRW